jgi:hypothetical protein
MCYLSDSVTITASAEEEIGGIPGRECCLLVLKAVSGVKAEFSNLYTAVDMYLYGSEGTLEHAGRCSSLRSVVFMLLDPTPTLVVNLHLLKSQRSFDERSFDGSGIK